MDRELVILGTTELTKSGQDIALWDFTSDRIDICSHLRFNQLLEGDPLIQSAITTLRIRCQCESDYTSLIDAALHGIAASHIALNCCSAIKTLHLDIGSHDNQVLINAFDALRLMSSGLTSLFVAMSPQCQINAAFEQRIATVLNSALQRHARTLMHLAINFSELRGPNVEVSAGVFSLFDVLPIGFSSLSLQEIPCPPGDSPTLLPLVSLATLHVEDCDLQWLSRSILPRLTEPLKLLDIVFEYSNEEHGLVLPQTLRWAPGGLLRLLCHQHLLIEGLEPFAEAKHESLHLVIHSSDWFGDDIDLDNLYADFDIFGDTNFMPMLSVLHLTALPQQRRRTPAVDEIFPGGVTALQQAVGHRALTIIPCVWEF